MNTMQNGDKVYQENLDFKYDICIYLRTRNSTLVSYEEFMDDVLCKRPLQ